jgi:hypothetical protein
MRFPTLEDDFWRLDSAVERHDANPGNFWIPDVAERASLLPGDLAQLRFEIEVEEDGDVSVQAERMWVCVRGVADWGYWGILVNTPAGYEDTEDVYLVYGAEVPFSAEHVIDIQRAADRAANLDRDVMRRPSRRWAEWDNASPARPE